MCSSLASSHLRVSCHWLCWTWEILLASSHRSPPLSPLLLPNPCHTNQIHTKSNHFSNMRVSVWNTLEEVIQTGLHYIFYFLLQLGLLKHHLKNQRSGNLNMSESQDKSVYHIIFCKHELKGIKLETTVWICESRQRKNQLSKEELQATLKIGQKY